MPSSVKHMHFISKDIPQFASFYSFTKDMHFISFKNYPIVSCIYPFWYIYVLMIIADLKLHDRLSIHDFPLNYFFYRICSINNYAYIIHRHLNAWKCGLLLPLQQRMLKFFRTTLRIPQKEKLVFSMTLACQ